MQGRGPFLYGQAAPQPAASEPGLLEEDVRNDTHSLQKMQVPSAAQSATLRDSEAETPPAVGGSLAEEPRATPPAEVIDAPFVSWTVARGLAFPVNILRGPQHPPSDPDTGGSKVDEDLFREHE